MDAALKVYEAIAAVTAELSIDGIAKDRDNKQQGYKFRGIDDVYNVLSPILSKHKLCMLPRILAREVSERQTKSGSVLFTVVVEAEFDLVSAVDGSRHTIRTFGEAMDSADKATNKAMSAAFKYAAMQAFCIPTEGDNDADATTHDVAPKVETKANSRETFDRLSKANRALTNTAAFDKFWMQTSVINAVGTLPPDWKRSLKAEKDDKAAELAERAEKAAAEHPFPGDDPFAEESTEQLEPA